MTKPPEENSNDKTPFAIRYKWWLIALAVLLVVFAILTALASKSMSRLDERIQSVFEGPKWSIPARVYSRPLELYAGLSIDPAAVKEELQRLGYQPGNELTPRPGQYKEQASSLSVHTRGFKFPDGFEASNLLSLQWQDKQITSIKDAAGNDVAIARLEPLVIGRISPTQTEDRLLVKLEQLPEGLIAALLAVEDPKFYQHNGLSIRGILRAIWVNITERRFAQGGSTLTQQLVKNLFLTRERTIRRKMTEWPMAIALERRYSKEEILQAFTNEVFFAQDDARAIHGFGLASLYFFDRPVQELQIHESALLVALLKGPSYYSPIRHPARALQRRNLVLDIMHRNGILEAPELASYKAAPLGINRNNSVLQQPAYLDLVKQQLERDYSTEDLHENGLNVFTNFDPAVQNKLEEAVEAAYQHIETEQSLTPEDIEKLQTAALVTRADNGEVLAVLGGREARYAGFNRAIDAKRQIGSLVKPFVYAAALEQPETFNLASIIQDSPVTLELPNGDTWSPNNFSEESYGPVLLLDALTHSLNLATVNLGLEVSVDQFVSALQRFGLPRSIEPLPSTLLGAIELSVIEVAALYQSLASGGFGTQLRAIREVQASDGQLLQRYSFRLQQRLDSATNHQINYALQNVMRSGTGRRAYRYISPDISLAGKSGTSNEQRDGWFAGYDGFHSTVVWMGHDDNSPTPLTGSRGALEVWARTMANLNPVSLQFSAPQSIEYASINPATGNRIVSDCPNALALPFHREFQPPGNPAALLAGSCE